MVQFTKVLTSAGVALALSFLFYAQRDVSGESYRVPQVVQGRYAPFGQAQDFDPAQAAVVQKRTPGGPHAVQTDIFMGGMGGLS